jgi:cyclopropane fatty-acyl-phospholipid synthase-like methyltransferase
MTKRGYGFEFICWALENPITAAAVPLPLALAYMFLMGKSIFWLPIYFAMFVALPALAFVIGMLVFSQLHDPGNANWDDYITDHDGTLRSFKGQKIPIDTVVEAYLAGKIDFKKPVLEIFLRRNTLFRFNFTLNHVQFFCTTFFSQMTGHSKVDDHREVGDVYNRGNDFYNFFLGETMIYTSGMWINDEETLEVAQYRKLDTIAKYIHLKEGDEHLDIGCGWGTLICHYADKYKTKSTGCTLAKEQVQYGKGQAEKRGVLNKLTFLCCDYREIPKESNNKKYDKITCLEMAEHVGIKNFQNFLLQVNDMLKDEGIFYLQIAGLRRSWHWEDLVWGLFMGRYIFPGADASCPLAFVVNQLERAGFEVHRVENMGVHYSRTIERWYHNWAKNEDAVIKAYGKWWFRLWMVFLAWSVMIARQGSSTVFMITCNKNHKNDASSVVDTKAEKAPFDRLGTWIGPNPIASQQ